MHYRTALPITLLITESKCQFLLQMCALRSLQISFARSFQPQEYSTFRNSLFQVLDTALQFRSLHFQLLTLHLPSCYWLALASYPRQRSRTISKGVEPIRTRVPKPSAPSYPPQAWSCSSYRFIRAQHIRGNNDFGLHSSCKRD